MLLKTHLAISIFFILLFLPVVEYKILFIIVAIIATCLPDLDTRFSHIGRKKIFRIFQFFSKHRGMIHSYTFLLALTLFLVLFVPVLAFGFFLGYSLHLLADSFNPSGIRPFYPSKKESKWKIRTGGYTEIVILTIFVIVDLGLFVFRIASIF